ncbi:tetratricopeptide repeat protein [Streptomyces sp. BV286]|uniref:FxSxx-COOH system tetratricopeptide repeat protein n=1 Tax=unclassified Streptomyces TaxID=2593676 RepID=UPI001C2E718E|nr:FxSxx-COOH system tetratricopeptide repeat protein [Streptomyces sp. BV286]MBV1941870.1 tetratricopeptide repeat protein [Streptomyces sp. BV286]
MGGASDRADFYLSYHPADLSWAHWLSWVLEQNGYKVFVQDWDLKPGENIVARKAQALDRCDFTLAVVTPAYLAAPACRDDWTSAFLQDPDGRDRLVCVQTEVCDLPRQLRTRGVIDLQDRPEGEAQAVLLDSLDPGRRRLTAHPGYPRFLDRAAEPPRFPAVPPSIFNVPPRNDHFTGRLNHLRGLHGHLETVTVLQAAVHGLGGVGKSQVAIEYAHRYATSYDIIWWVAAEQHAVMQADISALAAALDIPLTGDQRRQTEALYAELRRRGRWLIIYDNAEHPDDVYPLPEGGRVLITSRNPNWANVATAMSLDVLTDAEASGFLDKRLSTGDPHDYGSPTDIGELRQRLGNLPLALEQAAAFIQAAGINVRDYLGLLSTSPRDAFSTRPPVGYALTVVDTWMLTLDKIEKTCPDAYRLLLFCAFLAPDQIPRRVLSRPESRLPRHLSKVVTTPSRYIAAVSALRRYSMVKATPEEISLHRLVQWVVRQRANRSGPQPAELVSDVVRWLLSIYPLSAGEPENAALADTLLPHVLAVHDHVPAYRHNAPRRELAVLLERSAVFLHASTRLKTAETLFDSALRHLSGVKPTDPQLLRTQLAYGRLLQDVGRTDKAHHLFEQVLVQARKRQAGRSGLLTPALVDMGRLLQEEGRLREARERVTEALALAPAERLPVELQAKVYGSLGRIQQDLGEIPEARRAYELALRLAVQTFGESDSRVALRRNNLAGALHLAGDMEGARRHLDAALAGLTRIYGGEHDRTVAVRVNLGAALQALGEYRAARVQLDQALQVCGKLELHEDPRIPMILTGLGVLSQDDDDLPQAITHHRAALEAGLKLYLPDHPRMVVLSSNAGAAMTREGSVAEASTTLREALGAAGALYGEHHPRVAVVRSHWGMCLAAAGDTGQAWTQESLALEDSQRTYGDRHQRVATIQNNLGCIRWMQGRPRESGELFSRALQIATLAYGPAHPRTAVFRANLTISDGDPVSGAGPEPAALFIPLHIHQQATTIDR